MLFSPHRHHVEWPTWAALGTCYLTWGLFAFWLFPRMPALALAGMAVCVAFHSSLQHEAIHGHPTRNAHLNEMLVGVPLGLFYPYRRYRATHLRHHANHHLTDPAEDPESYYHDQKSWNSMSPFWQWLFTLNNTLLGRLILGPGISVIRFIHGDARTMMHNNAEIARDWLWHLASLAAFASCLHYIMHVPFWLYLIGPAYGGASLIAVRSYAEHRWHDDPEARSVIVEKSWLAPLFLNNNLHAVHHAHPGLAWYRLPAVYHAGRADWQTRNAGYVFRNYSGWLRAYLWRRKEPLPHPKANEAGF